MASISLEVARDADAARIAGMSRWLIEHGLKWPRCQRRGIGQRLVRWLEESAVVAGTFSVSLEVRARNWPARRFYRQLGYADTGVARLYYGGCEDAIRMSRDLRVCRSANMC
jgi:GNAT superfamily N-acetyltransferase